MEIKDMTINDIEARAKEIREAMKAEDADLDALTAEVDALEERKAEIRAEVEARAKEAEQVANGLVGKTKEKHEEKKKMTLEEMRKSSAYADAYAHYIKTGKADQCRALMAKVEERDGETETLVSENADGTVPVPADVEARVRTAWERDGIMSRIRKSYFKGNHKVFYEISGTDAVDHEEGGPAVDPEELVLGTLELIPKYAKKWLPVTDEVYSLTSSEFLAYIYDELTYRVIKKIAERLLNNIVGLANGTAQGPAVAKITAQAADLSVIAQALANLSEDAADPVIIMNKKTWGEFEAARAAANYAFDPYYGLPIIFNNKLATFADASATAPVVIVGDLYEGALANFPNGENLEFKFDDKTEMTSDIIRILGKLFCGVGVVAPNAFTVVTAGGSSTPGGGDIGSSD